MCDGGGRSAGRPPFARDAGNGRHGAGQTAKKLFVRYVSQNILGMLGISAYVLADTFFISAAEGADGITALNLVLPLYSLIFAVGSMIATGSATRFKIYRARNEEKAEDYFSNAVFFALLFGFIFILLGIFVPDNLLRLLGASEEIVALGTPYTRIFLLFGPMFLLNYICNAFVRNDGNPTRAMIATFSSSIFNIVFDYVLMFPMKLGMTGAALATACSPVVGVLICCTHLMSERGTVRFLWKAPSIKRLAHACQLGLAAFMGEISSGVTTMIFNFLILGLAGNVGVAAYGIVANVAIVATAIFNGISQGTQPLLSDYYGKSDGASIKKVVKLSVLSALAAAALIVLAANLFPAQLIAAFNSEKNAAMAAYAMPGVRIYFAGYLFAGFNIVGTGYLSATDNAGWAFAVSVLRGLAAIAVCAVVLSALWGMTGIWLAFPMAELITAVVMVWGIRRTWLGEGDR